MKPEPKVIALEGADGEIRLSPPVFVDNRVDVDPADLSQFSPQGNGVYGLQHKQVDPFAMGESMEPSSGVVFFDTPHGGGEEDFYGMLRILGIANTYLPVGDRHNTRYWAFEQVSKQPGKDGYIRQLRIMDRFALQHLYGVLDSPGYEGFPVQPLPLPQFLWAFMLSEIKQYGTSFGSPELAGKFGGDGHFAQESLSFGFMIENAYYKIYRIWSRAWLCTK
jgi:hypothetical protein